VFPARGPGAFGADRGGTPVSGDSSSSPPASGGSFTDRVVAAVRTLGPLCAGVDPSTALLSAWGLDDDPAGLSEMAMRCIDAFAGVVPVVKPQVAFFERFGSRGYAVLEQVMTAARDAGLLIIADAKRGDIGSTAEGYAAAWLDPASPLAADAVTVTPYLGLGALQPMVDLAATHGAGVVVVVSSSNAEGRLVQEARTADGQAVEDALLAQVAATNRVRPGCVGAVVGATRQAPGFPLAELGGVILAPGVGAQGAGAGEIGRLFRDCPPGSVLPNVSRSVLAHGPDVGAIRLAAAAVRDEMAAVLS